MARILLIAALVVAGFFVLGSVIGFIVSAVKWLLIIGAIALIVSVILKITRSGAGRTSHYN